MSKNVKTNITSKISVFTMLGLTILGPALTVSNVIADEVQSHATNYKDGQKINKANKTSLSKAGQNNGKTSEITVPQNELMDTVNKLNKNVNLSEGDVIDRGTFNQGNIHGLDQIQKSIAEDYQRQAKEIKTLSDKYEADLAFYNANKQTIDTLSNELTKLAQDATKLGAKIDKGSIVTGKSFQEIQDSLKTQIETMKALVAKQQTANTNFENASNEYKTKVAEIKQLETKLEELSNQGKALGATITKNQVTDSKTLDEIKTLLNGQVSTLTELAKKQDEVNKKFESDLKAYNANVTEVAQLTKELNDLASALSNTKNVNVTANSVEKGKTFDEIKTRLKAQIADAKQKKSEQESAIRTDNTAQAEYDKALAKYKDDLKKYQPLKDKYDKDLAKYKEDKAKYDTDKVKYNTDKVAYEKALQNAEANKDKEGYLSQVEAQSLIFKSEPNAVPHFELGSNDDYFIKKSSALKKGGDVRHLIDASLWKNSDGTQTPEQMLILDNDNKVTTSPYVLVNSSVGKTTTVTYDLKNSYFNGKKLGKVVVKYTPLQSSANDNRVVMAIHQDPTVTVWFGSAYDKKGQGNRLKQEYQYFYEDGTPVEFDEEHKGIVSFASRNNHGKGVYAEDFGDLSSNMKFVKITGSSIDKQPDGRYYSKDDNNSYKGNAAYTSWDTHGNPNEFWGAGAATVNSGSKFSFTIGASNVDKNWGTNVRQWFAFNSDIKAAGVPQKPVEPVEPKFNETEPKAPIPPKKKGGVLPTVDFEYNLYENPAKPTKTNLSGTYSSVVLPKEPVKNTPESGKYNEFTIPNPPEKPSYVYHVNKLRVYQDGVKEVKDTDETDVNNQMIPKSSTIMFNLKVHQLPANRKETKEFTITDALPQGAKFKKDATLNHPNNKKWDFTFDEKNEIVTFKPKAEYIEEFNKNLNSKFDIQYPTIVAEVQNDDAVYENNFTVKHNDNEYYSNIVTVTTAIPPTLTRDGEDDGGKNNKKRKEKPLKAVNDEKGNDINTLNVKPEDIVYYNLTWSNENYKGIKASVKKVADGFFYAEDIDEKAVTPLLDQLEVTVKATGEKVEGVHAEYYESLEKAPKEVQDKYKQQGIEPKGGFVHIWVDDEHETEHNAKYKVTGQDLNIKFPVKVNKDFTGQFENTAYQSDYGNGYKTNTVKSNVSVQKTDKFVTTGDKVDVTKLTEKDKVKEIPKRKNNYNWVVKNTLDEYSVKNNLYKELALTDNGFADVQTADKVSVMDSKGNDVTSETNIEVWVDGKLYSVNGTLSNQTLADNTDVTDKAVRGDAKTNDKKLLSKDKNLLLPDNLNVDGKKSTVEIKAVFKDASKVKDTTYYAVYHGVSTLRANTAEIKNYVVDGNKLEIENKARIDYKFKFDETWNQTKESKAKVRISVVQPKEVKTTKYVTKGKVDVSKLTDADKATSISSQLDKYNWIIKAELNKESVANNAYKSLSIVDKEFADLQSVSKVTLRTKDNKDITDLVDIQVWKDGQLYSVNGQEGTEAKTDATGKTNVLLPKDLNKDGKKANIQIKAVFKNPEELSQTEYYLAFEDVNYENASEDEIKNYKSGDKVKVDNVANAEYAGSLDEDGKVKQTADTKANIEQEAPKPLTPEKKTPNTRWIDEQGNKLKEPKEGTYPDEEGDDVEGWTLVRIETDKDGNVTNVYRRTPKVLPKNLQKFAPTGVADVAKYGFLAAAILSILGLLGFKKFKRSENN